MALVLLICHPVYSIPENTEHALDMEFNIGIFFKTDLAIVYCENYNVIKSDSILLHLNLRSVNRYKIS